MKRIAMIAAMLPLTFTGAFAQGVYIGPGGVGVDTGIRGGNDHVVREYQDDQGCTVRVIRRNGPDGEETLRDRRCD
jgi:hypothetical protein